MKMNNILLVGLFKDYTAIETAILIVWWLIMVVV